MITGFFVRVFLLFASICSCMLLNGDQPKVETDLSQNGLAHLSSRFHSESTEFNVFADLLVWTTRESGSDNWAEVIYADGSTTTCNIRDVHFGWDPGFRVGVGYGMKHDQWDTQFYYTWFHTEGDDRVSSRPGSVYSSYIGNFYVDNPTGAGISGVAYQKASIDWKIHFNVFDWELGRAFWVSRALSLRPFIGLKGGWIHQAIHTSWHDPNLSLPLYVGAPSFEKGIENLKNDFAGVGPSAGLDTKWNLLVRDPHVLSLCGDFSGAIMWGRWSFRDKYHNDIGQRVSIKTAPFTSGASMLRALLGLQWEASLNQGRYLFSSKLGYEIQFWLNQLQFYSFDTGRLSNVLTFQGGTLELRFDF